MKPLIDHKELLLCCYSPEYQHNEIKLWSIKLGEELEFVINVICKTIHTNPIVSFNNEIFTISDHENFKNFQIKLISDCKSLNGNIFNEIITVGLDDRLSYNMQMSAYVSKLNYPIFRLAILHLILSPHKNQKINLPIFPTDILIIDELHKQCIKNNILYQIPKNQKKLNGRILWIDANPHIDTILDPYGLSILNTIARNEGFLGYIVAPFLEWDDPENELKKITQRFKPDLIGISIRNLDDVVTIKSLNGADNVIDTNNYFQRVVTLSTLISEHYQGPVIIGGSGINKAPEIYMKALKIPYGIQGSAERIIQSFLSKWRPKAGKRSINTTYFENLWNKIPGAISLFHQQKNDKLDLQSSNFSANIKIPRDPIRVWYENYLGIFTAIRGSYGCPLNCTYCIEGTPGKKVEKRDAIDVVDEMEWVMNEYNISEFHLTDSEANLPFSKITDIAEEIIKRKLGEKIKWTMYSTPYPWNIETIPKLIKAGMSGIKLSVDHFFDQQLKSLGRTHNEKQIQKILTALDAYKEKVTISCSILLGAPGETISSIKYASKQMMYFAEKGFIFYYNVGIRLYPGTLLYDQWKQEQMKPENLFGSGLSDDGISPLVYCVPKEPRVLTKELTSIFFRYPNIRGIESGRPQSLDPYLRRVTMIIFNWYKGDITMVNKLLKPLNLNLTTNANLIDKILTYEREIRQKKQFHIKMEN